MTQSTKEKRTEAERQTYRLRRYSANMEDYLEAILTLSSGSYGYLYPGTAEEADAAPQETWIPPEDSSRDAYTFRVPIPALDEPVDVAAWSKKYEKWYDRQLTFLSGSLRAQEQAAEKTPFLAADGGDPAGCAGMRVLWQVKMVFSQPRGRFPVDSRYEKGYIRGALTAIANCGGRLC